MLCSIANNYLCAEGGMKLAEAFAKMPNLRKVKCVPRLMRRLPSHEIAGYPPLSTCLVWNVCRSQLGQEQYLRCFFNALEHVPSRSHQRDL